MPVATALYNGKSPCVATVCQVVCVWVTFSAPFNDGAPTFTRQDNTGCSGESTDRVLLSGCGKSDVSITSNSTCTCCHTLSRTHLHTLHYSCKVSQKYQCGPVVSQRDPSSGLVIKHACDHTESKTFHWTWMSHRCLFYNSGLVVKLLFGLSRDVHVPTCILGPAYLW